MIMQPTAMDADDTDYDYYTDETGHNVWTCWPVCEHEATGPDRPGQREGMMAKIRTTGNHDIDEATAEIALALASADIGCKPDQDYYDKAMQLRDMIMAGTRALNHQAALTAYLAAKESCERLVNAWASSAQPGDQVPDEVKEAKYRLDAMKAAAAGEAGPGEPLCCQRYSRLHHPAFSVPGCPNA